MLSCNEMIYIKLLVYSWLSGIGNPKTETPNIHHDVHSVANTNLPDTMLLRQKISAELHRHPEGVFAVAFKDLQSGTTFFMNERQPFHAASTMKTPVMIETYKQAAEGKFAINDSILIKNEFKSIVDGSAYSLTAEDDSEKELYQKIGLRLPIYDILHRMITMSSNLATNIIIELVGADHVNATMRMMGANDIQVLRGVEDNKAYQQGLNNTTSAYDLMLIMEQLALGTAVNRESSEAMIGILMNQHFNEKIGGNLPVGVRVASKSGSITAVSHDSGIVFLPDGRKYVVVLLSKGVKDQDDVDKTLARVSRILYDYIVEK